jgi:hypothetical protein
MAVMTIVATAVNGKNIIYYGPRVLNYKPVSSAKGSRFQSPLTKTKGFVVFIRLFRSISTKRLREKYIT